MLKEKVFDECHWSVDVSLFQIGYCDSIHITLVVNALRLNHFTKIVCTMFAHAKEMFHSVSVQFLLHMQMNAQDKVSSSIGDIL